MKTLLSTRRTFIAVIFLGLAALGTRNMIDPDVWWHLKTGQYIAEHREVPHTDPFSYTRAGTPWVAHEWLTDLVLYGLYRTAGWAGLIVVFAAIVSASFVPLFLRCGGGPFLAGILTLFGAWATAPIWGVRPQILSILLTSLWLWILERSESRQKLLWWTFPIVILWVNLHAGFALGIALIALFLAGELLGQRSNRRVVNSSRLRALAGTLLFNLLLVPLNPYGARMYSYPLETLRSKAMQNYIAEWASPNFHRPEYFPLLILLVATVGVLAWSKARVRPRDMLLLAVATLAALSSIRMIPFFVLISVPVISNAFQAKASLAALPPPRRKLHPALQVLNAGIVLFMVAFTGVQSAHVIRRQPQVEAENFPIATVAFLENHPFSGPIFNHYDWGGYLIWRLSPETRVFIDGRADVYGEALLQQFADTYQMKHDWQHTLKKWGIVRAIVPPDSPLATGLRSSPDWTVSYEDAQGVVLSKTQPRPAAPLQTRQ